MIEFFGRSPLDILRRWAVSTSTVADYEKTAAIDDMMKAVVRDNFITTPHVAPAGEFSCDGDLALGPVIYQSFPGKNVLDILTDLKATSFSMNAVSSSDRRIFFDVVEGPGVTGGFGYIFRTYADLRGTNRLNGIVFSPENGNLKAPYFYEDYLDEFTEVQVGNTTVTSTDSTLSRWNVCRMYQNIVSSDADVEASEAYKILNDKAKILSLGAQFLSTPGSTDQPRSLYGVDWDLGDLLLCQYAGKNMGAEVEIVWVSVNEEGEENIVGSNRVGVL